MSTEWLWIIIAIIIILILIGVLIYLAWSGASSTAIWLVAGALLIFIIIMVLLIAFWPKAPQTVHDHHVVAVNTPAQTPSTNVTFNTADPNAQAPVVNHFHNWGPTGSPTPNWTSGSAPGRPGEIPNGTMSQTDIPLGPMMMDRDQTETTSIHGGMTFRGQTPDGMGATFTTPSTMRVTKTNPGPVPVNSNNLGQFMGTGIMGQQKTAIFAIN